MNKLKSLIHYWIKSKYEHLIYTEELRKSYEGVSVSGGTLKDRLIVVVGGTGDIGKAIVKRFLAEGCTIIILARNETKIKTLIADLKGKYSGEVIDYQIVDFENSDSIRDAVSKISKYDYEILINCVGVFSQQDKQRSFRSVTKEQLNKSWDVNYENVSLLTELIATEMIKKNDIRQRIINIGSICAVRRPYQSTPYGMSKSAVQHMTEFLNHRYDTLPILCIEPGTVATVMGGKKIGSDISNVNNFLGRNSLPEEIASVTAFLCTNVGQYVYPIIEASACESFWDMIFGGRTMKKLKPIVEANIYKSAFCSYCGNSLSGSIVIFLCSKEDSSLWDSDGKRLLDNENCNYQKCYFEDTAICLGTLTDGTKPIHYINCFDISKLGVDKIYQVLQIEVTSLVKDNIPASICSIFRNVNDEEYNDYVKKGVVSDMLNGLASLLSVHHITYTGICTDIKVPFDVVMQTAVFLSSKYGQVMSGSVIELN